MMVRMPDNSPPPDSRRARLWKAAESAGVPLRTILVTVAVVALAYLLGKLIFRLRDVLLLIVVAGFIAVILNPLVVALQRWRIPRRGWAVAVVTLWGLLVFVGLTVAFGFPLVQRDHPPGRHAAGVREQGRARQGLDRAPGAQVPRAALDPEQRAQAGRLRQGPRVAGPERGQGRVLAGDRAADHLRADGAAAARGPQDAGRPAGHDVARAGGALLADRAGGQPLGHRLHAGELPDLAHRRRPSCS